MKTATLDPRLRGDDIGPHMERRLLSFLRKQESIRSLGKKPGVKLEKIRRIEFTSVSKYDKIEYAP